MEHTFLIDNYVLVLERKKIKFKKKRKKFLTNPIYLGSSSASSLRMFNYLFYALLKLIIIKYLFDKNELV